MSADAYRFCNRCQKLRLKADFVPIPIRGRRAWVKECCKVCAKTLIENQRRIDPTKIAHA